MAAWRDDAAYADFRERAWLNSVLPTQKRGDRGAYLYSHPLGASSRKVYGDAEQTFWCCYGTGVEAPSAGSPTACTPKRATRCTSGSSSRPRRGGRRTACASCRTPPFRTNKRYASRSMPIRRRRSRYACACPRGAAGASCTLNGHPVAVTAGSPVALTRTWNGGDRVELRLPMTLRTEMLPGDPTHWAFVYGPVVLAARTPHTPELACPASRAATLVRGTDAARLCFEVPLVSGHVGAARALGARSTTKRTGCTSRRRAEGSTCGESRS